MSGFDPTRLNAEFFGGSTRTANFLVNLGYPDDSEYKPRASRLTFAECVRIL
jgi:3-hydroxypropanoate dehydrogenase